MRITYYSITILFLLSNVFLFAQDTNEAKNKLYSMLGFQKANYKKNCTEEFDEEYYNLLNKSEVKKNKAEYKKISDLKSKNVKSCERIKLIKDEIAGFESSNQDILQYPIKYLNKCNSYIAESKNFGFTDNIHFSYCLHVFVSISSISLKDQDKDFCPSTIKLIDEILSPFNSVKDEPHNFSIKSDKYVKDIKEKCDIFNKIDKLNEKIKKLSTQGYLSNNVEKDINDLKIEIKDMHEKYKIDNYDEIMDFFNTKYIDLKIYEITNKNDFSTDIIESVFLEINGSVFPNQAPNHFFILKNSLTMSKISLFLIIKSFFLYSDLRVDCKIGKNILYTAILEKEIECYKENKLAFTIKIGSFFSRHHIPLINESDHNLSHILNRNNGYTNIFKEIKEIFPSIPILSPYNLGTRLLSLTLNKKPITKIDKVKIIYRSNQNKDTLLSSTNATIDMSKVNNCWRNYLLGRFLTYVTIGDRVSIECPSNINSKSKDTYLYDILILDIQ